MGRGGRILRSSARGEERLCRSFGVYLAGNCENMFFRAEGESVPVSSRDRALTVADESIRARTVFASLRGARARSLAHVRGCTCV